MKSSFCANGASCVEVGLDGGGNVLVWDSKSPIVPPLVWEPDAWQFLLDRIRWEWDHQAVRHYSDGVSFGRPGVDEDYLLFTRDEWYAFVQGVKAGEFDPDRLKRSSSASSVAGGRVDAERPGSDPVKPPHASEARHGHDPSSNLVSRDLPNRNPAATGAGDSDPVPAPVAAPCRCHKSWAAVVPFHTGHCCFWPPSQKCHPDEVAAWQQASSDVPAGRLSDQPCDPTTPPPLGVDQPGPELLEAYAQGYAAAVAALRDDDRYMNWWTSSNCQPSGPVRYHLADYLECVGPDGYDVTANAPAIDDPIADELLRRGAAPLVDHNPDGAS